MNGKWPWMMSQYTKQKVVVFFFLWSRLQSVAWWLWHTFTLRHSRKANTSTKRKMCTAKRNREPTKSLASIVFLFYFSTACLCEFSLIAHSRRTSQSSGAYPKILAKKKKKRVIVWIVTAISKWLGARSAWVPHFPQVLSSLFFCFAIIKLDVNWRFDPDSMYASSKCQRYRFRTPLCVCRPFHYTQHLDIGLLHLSYSMYAGTRINNSSERWRTSLSIRHNFRSIDPKLKNNIARPKTRHGPEVKTRANRILKKGG